MADTFTAKLGLRQYDAALNYAVSKFSADNLLIDNAFGTVICTSTTRPSTGLFNGMQLWETDTRRFVVRVSAAWVAVPGRAIIADVAARTAITTPYDGMVIYRQDRDWHEAYDGAAWRVMGVAHCTSTADRDGASGITSPYNGQLATTTDTGALWIRQAGAWHPTRTTAEGVQSTSNIAMTTSFQDLTGATVTYTTPGTNRDVEITAALDADSTGTTDIGVGICLVDGVALAGEIHWGPVGRATYGKTWKTTLSTAASHTIKLQARKTGTTNGFSTYATHTNIVVKTANI